MTVEVTVLDDRVVVELRGWDRLMNWRSKVVFDRIDIESVSASDRLSLESQIDHRASGAGTHDGSSGGSNLDEQQRRG